MLRLPNIDPCDSSEMAFPCSSALVAEVPTTSSELIMQEEGSDYAELEEFAEHFRKTRKALGFSQKRVGESLGGLGMCGVAFSQTMVSRFEKLKLSYSNLRALLPMFVIWLDIIEGKGTREGMAPHETQVKPSKTPPQSRRKRTQFDSADKQILEKNFQANSKPPPQTLMSLAFSLDLDPQVVQVWFFNRRQKARRESMSKQWQLAAIQGE